MVERSLPKLPSIDKLLLPESFLPKNAVSGLSKIADSFNRVLFAPRQKSLGEALTADAYDELIGIVPFIGDAIGNGSRAAVAKANNDEEAALLHGLDFTIGLVPLFGDAVDFVIPANTILFLRDASKCAQSGKGRMECLFPEDSLEREIYKMMRRKE